MAKSSGRRGSKKIFRESETSTNPNNVPKFNDDKAARELAINRASVSAFQHPGDAIEADVKEELVAQLAAVLTPVFQYIAKGRLGNTMAARSWVVLHETRLDLIAGESIEDFAKRIGVSHTRVHELVKEFRAMVPAYRSANRKRASTCIKMSTAHRRARAGTTPPPGKESLSGDRALAGSAKALTSHT